MIKSVLAVSAISLVIGLGATTAQAAPTVPTAVSNDAPTLVQTVAYHRHHHHNCFWTARHHHRVRVCK